MSDEDHGVPEEPPGDRAEVDHDGPAPAEVDDDGPAPAEVGGEHRSWGRRLRIVAVAVVALAAVFAVAVGVFAVHLDSNIERIGDPFADLPSRPPVVTPSPEPSEEPEPELPMNVLLLGSDSRISAGDPSAWEFGAQRTDVMMLVHITADRQSVQVMSIPRDSWVEIPGYGMAKLNAAYSFGGPPLLIQTFEALTGVHIDHFAMTDFESFADITDALGGVHLTLLETMHRGDVTLPPGEHLMTGAQALVYVRERFHLPRGDFDRVLRHQAWMRAILAEVDAEGLLRDPARVVRFLDAVSHSIAVDAGLTRTVMQELLWECREVTSADVDFFTVPIQGISTSDDGQSIVLLNRPHFDELMAAVREDRIREYLATHGDDVDRLPTVPR